MSLENLLKIQQLQRHTATALDTKSGAGQYSIV